MCTCFVLPIWYYFCTGCAFWHNPPPPRCVLVAKVMPSQLVAMPTFKLSSSDSFSSSFLHCTWKKSVCLRSLPMGRPVWPLIIFNNTSWWIIRNLETIHQMYWQGIRFRIKRFGTQRVDLVGLNTANCMNTVKRLNIVSVFDSYVDILFQPCWY